ncbi:MAG: spermidine synthase [Omnitrophica WOR_2 bacterium]|jgi:spermidine synthase
MKKGSKITDYLNSFFTEKVIDIFNSDINPQLEVAIINGRYQLNAGSVNYSFGPLHDAFRKYFSKDQPSLNDDSQVLILGLGAGSVANIIRNELEYKCQITGVEIDTAVVEAARKHFALDKVTNLNVIIDDAYDFVENSTDKYDLIIVDLYIEDKVPLKFESFQFIQNLRRLLYKEGKVVFNKLKQAGKEEMQIEVLTKYFQTIFEKTDIVKVTVNKNCPNYFLTGIVTG